MVDEERYSNRQIERLLDEQSKDIKEHIDAKTEPILSQTTRTNGRVNNNEADIIRYKIWRGWMTGSLAVIGLMLPVVLAIQAWEIEQILNITSSVHTAVDDAINARVVPNSN